MATMYGLFLESERCPDGIELFALSAEIMPRFRERTARREPIRLQIQNLENPTVVEFINARNNEDRAKFFSKFGTLFYGSPRTGDEYAGTDLDVVAKQQKELRGWLATAAGSSQVDALHAINSSLARYRLLNLQPAFDLAGEGGAPRMLLRCEDLMQFMTMEIAMVAMHGAKLAECEHCKDVFLTGPLTGRRSHAKYCSARCRVAAMRARNAANAKP